jgi:hypothetical protein
MVPTRIAIDRTSRRHGARAAVARRWQRLAAMRFAIVVVAALAACSEEGAHLTLSAPRGPISASSYRVVLATPDVVPVIDNQRVAPDKMATETVTYYLQRTDAGVMVGSVDFVDGFTILVEPNPAIDETAFIPFVILYDDSARIVGIGTFHASDQSADPSPILVPRGEVDKYTLDVEAVTDVDDAVATDPGDALQVTCAHTDQTTFASGVAWRPHAGGERRILLPDDVGSTDATQRPLDLDCDGAVVASDASSSDCDDTRARFHSGATEVCDGEDTNCDAVPYTVQSCTDGSLCGTTAGTALCDDTTGTLGACHSDVRCVCATSGSSACAKCVLEFIHGSNGSELDPCEPQEGTVSTSGLCEATTCTVYVTATHGGWQAYVGATSQQLGAIATNVKAQFVLKVKGPNAVMTQVNASVGVVDLVIAPDNGSPPALLSLDLELGTNVSACSGGGPFPMTCTVP